VLGHDKHSQIISRVLNKKQVLGHFTKQVLGHWSLGD